MFDWYITSEYVKLLTNEKIIMKWRHRNQLEEHYATVALNFVSALGQVELQLKCKGDSVSKEKSMKFCFKWLQEIFRDLPDLEVIKVF